MAKGIYVGVDSKARKIKKLYAGVNNVAKKIKKAYVGVGGKARLCWALKGIYQYGMITPLSAGRGMPGKGTIGNRAFFAGGGSVLNKNTNTIDTYDTSLTLNSSAPVLSKKTAAVGDTVIGNYIIFAGGVDGTVTHASNTVDAYTSSLTKSILNELYNNKSCLSGGTVNNTYAIFAGGAYDNYYVDDEIGIIDIYNSSATKIGTSNTFLNRDRTFLGSAAIDKYLIFAGGYPPEEDGNVTIGGTGQHSDYVDIFDNSLTHLTSQSLTIAQGAVQGGTTTNYAIFCGNKNNVDAFNKSLTKTNIGTIEGNNFFAATSFKNYALFYSGNILVYFDDSLTKILEPGNVNTVTEGIQGTTIGNYALFAGGLNNYFSALTQVEAYTYFE